MSTVWQSPDGKVYRQANIKDCIEVHDVILSADEKRIPNVGQGFAITLFIFVVSYLLMLKVFSLHLLVANALLCFAYHFFAKEWATIGFHKDIKLINDEEYNRRLRYMRYFSLVLVLSHYGIAVYLLFLTNGLLDGILSAFLWMWGIEITRLVIDFHITFIYRHVDKKIWEFFGSSVYESKGDFIHRMKSLNATEREELDSDFKEYKMALLIKETSKRLARMLVEKMRQGTGPKLTMKNMGQNTTKGTVSHMVNEELKDAFVEALDRIDINSKLRANLREAVSTNTVEESDEARLLRIMKESNWTNDLRVITRQEVDESIASDVERYGNAPWLDSFNFIKERYNIQQFIIKNNRIPDVFNDIVPDYYSEGND